MHSIYVLLIYIKGSTLLQTAVYVYYSQTSAERSKVYKLSQTFKKKMYE